MSGLVRRVLSHTAYGWIRLTGAQPGLRVLMYHRVTDAHPEERLCVRPGEFAQQMRWLADDGWQPLTFAEAVEVAMGRREAPRKAVALTFDDGFADNYIHAAPELERNGFRGCFFVPSAFIASAGKQPHPEADRPMTWDELRDLLRRGHAVGGHSVTHRKLTLMPHADAVREITGCKAAIEAGLGKPIDWFCYPAGAYNAAIRDAVASAGFLGGCTVEPGPVKPRQDPYRLRRTEVSGFDSLEDFKRKLAGAFDGMHAALQAMQRRRKPVECANAMPAQDVDR